MDVLKQFVRGLEQGTTFKTRYLTSLNIDGSIGFLYADGSAVRICESFYKRNQEY